LFEFGVNFSFLGPIYFHYRTYEVTPDTVLNEEWLNARWLEKEALMHDFYTNPSQFLNQRAGQLRPVVLSWTKMVGISFVVLREPNAIQSDRSTYICSSWR